MFGCAWLGTGAGAQFCRDLCTRVVQPALTNLSLALQGFEPTPGPVSPADGKKGRDRARAEVFPDHPVRLSPKTVTIRLGDEESSANRPQRPTKVSSQEDFISEKPVITTSQAAVSCACLGIDGLLARLNDVLRTTYTLETPSLRSYLAQCISKRYDFGMAYALMRPWWFIDFSKLRSHLEDCREEDEKMRRDALDTSRQRIAAHQVRPRRVWDLYANRVVPVWVTRKPARAVSHSWMGADRRTTIRTPINSFQWPVPIPVDSSLERVRIELLNLDTEYAWLDVLCLRQVGESSMEAIRKREWLIDVPTIGHVYHQNQIIICYYSGLGRPFTIGNLSHHRHWLNRAWTLQEISQNTFTAGKTPDSPDLKNYAGNDPNIHAFVNRRTSILSFAQDVSNIFPVLCEMRQRFAVSELDKIAGLNYLLRARHVPVYIENQTAEDAWDNLLRIMHSRFLGHLLFLYPYPGPKVHYWVPSWEQIQDRARRWPASGGVCIEETVEMNFTEVPAKYTARHRGYRIDRCRIEGLEKEAGPGPDGKIHRVGNLLIGNHGFKVHALHGQAIDNGRLYTMISAKGYEYWLVGRVEDSGLVRKLTVLRMSNEDQAKMARLHLGSHRCSEFS